MQDLSLVGDLHHSLQQCWILNPLSEARDRTRNLVVPSWIRQPLRHDGNSHPKLFMEPLAHAIHSVQPARHMSIYLSNSPTICPSILSIPPSKAIYCTPGSSPQSVLDAQP